MSFATDGDLICVTGKSRSGKTSWVAGDCDTATRLFVWDIVGQWAAEFNCMPVYSVAALAACVKKGAPPMRIAFQPPEHIAPLPQLFNAWCRLVYIAMQQWRVVSVAEELSDVTSPGKAPFGWGIMCRRGLRYGGRSYAISQRPAESDKTAFGNRTAMRTFQMELERDVNYVAQQLRVPVTQVDALQPLQWIQRDSRTGDIRTGDLRKSRR